MTDDAITRRLEQITVGGIERRTVVLVDPDPGWPDEYSSEEARIRGVLDRPVELHHVGSTAVAGLPAKPVIDIVLVVSDPADEATYVPALASIGYELRIREPDWHEHRMLRLPPDRVHLHVFGPECSQVEQMLRFRDILRWRTDARDRYARVKRRLAAQAWPTRQHYADAKSDVVAQILQDGV